MIQTESKSKELTIIKGQMVNVISHLQQKHQLDEIMPLLNLLKTLESYINTNGSKECPITSSININEMKLKLGAQTVGLTHKISFLLNRIQIESAYLASINKSVAYGIKKYYKRKDINQFVHEKSYAIEKKRLFVLALRMILRDDAAVLVKSTGLNLESITNALLENVDSGIGSLMRSISSRCEVCRNGDESASDQRFCFCRLMNSIQHQDVQAFRYSGELHYELHSFMGLYEADYVERMLRQDAPRLTVDQFSSRPARHRRRCVIIVKDRCECSPWTHSASSLMLSGHMTVHKAKEIEIQVWQATPSTTSLSKRKTASHDRIVAAAIVPLSTLLEGSGDPISVALEPDGFVMVSMQLHPVPDVTSDRLVPVPAVADDTNRECKDVFNKFGLKRRPNILTKLGGHRLARHVEANVPVSVWTDWFQNHIDRLAIPLDSSEQQKIVEDNKENKTLGNLTARHNKIIITPVKHTNISTPKKPLNESYRQLAQTSLPIQKSTPKTAVCKFICYDKQSSAHQHNLTPSVATVGLHSAVVSTPISSKLRPGIFVTTPTSTRKSTVFQSPIPPPPKRLPFPTIPPRSAIKYFNMRRSSMVMAMDKSDIVNKSLTKSNIELANYESVSPRLSIKRSESLGSHCDDEDDEEDYETSHDDVVHTSLHSPLFDRSRVNLVPYACSPDLQRIPVCKIVSEVHRGVCNDSITDKTPSVDLAGKESQMGPTCLFDNIEETSDSDDESMPSDEQQPQPQWGLAQLQLLCVLGQGHFGKVVLARHHRSGALCALKSIQKVRASTEVEYETLLTERRILLRISEASHPFIIGLIGCFQTDRHVLFALQYAGGGDLMGHVHVQGAFGERDAAFYAACVVLAFEFLHETDIIYRDLKLDNVLMDRHGYAKLTDFGLSKDNMKWNDFTTTFCGTLEFLAPEIISQQRYTRAIDWWALGVLLFEMIVGESPFPGDEDDAIFHAIVNTTPDMSALSPDAHAIVMRLLQPKPEKRLGYGPNGSDKVKLHPFFRHIDWDQLYNRQMKCPFVPVLDDLADTKYFEEEFTSQPVAIEHEDARNDGEIIDDLFANFDSIPSDEDFL